jgi:siroheme synthase-like protein
LDVSDRLVVIIGGGSVAVRKARGLIDAGASRIRAVATDFDPALPVAVERIVAAYEPPHLDGAGLVFAATNVAAVNERVTLDAHARGLLVCRADWVDPQESEGNSGGDFVTPAALRRGPLHVFVAAGSSALSAALRDDIATRLRPVWIELSEAMKELRPMILRSGMTPERRRTALRELSGEPGLTVIEHSGREGLRRWLLERFAELNNVPGGKHD